MADAGRGNRRLRRRPSARPARSDWGEGLGGLAAAAPPPAPHPDLLPAKGVDRRPSLDGLCGEKGRVGAQAGDDRPGILSQTIEKIKSAPEDSLAPLQRGEGWGEGLGGLAAAAPPPAPHPDLLPAGGEKGRVGAPAGDDRPGILSQTIEKIKSAPGTPSPRFSGERVGVRGSGDWPLRLLARPLILTFSPQWASTDARLSTGYAGRRDASAPRQATIARRIPPQDLEKIKSAARRLPRPASAGRGLG